MFARMWLGLCVKTWFLKRRRYLFWSHWHQICLEKKCILIYLGSVLFLVQIAQPSFMHLKGMTLNSPNISHHNNKKGRHPSSHRILWQYNCSAFIFLLFPLLLFLWRTLKKIATSSFQWVFPTGTDGRKTNCCSSEANLLQEKFKEGTKGGKSQKFFRQSAQ